MTTGEQFGNSATMTFNDDEIITDTVIWRSSFDAGRAGAIRLRTNYGRIIYGGQRKTASFEQYTDTTKGALIGALGRSGAALDSLGILLGLFTDISYEYSNIRYNLEGAQLVHQRLIHMKEGEILNAASSATVQQSISISHSQNDVRNWSTAIDLKFGVPTIFKTTVPFFVEGKVELSAEANYTGEMGKSVIDRMMHVWTGIITVPQKKNVKWKAFATVFTIEVPYTAHVLIFKTDGSIRNMNIVGTYRGTNIGKFSLKIEDLKE